MAFIYDVHRNKPEYTPVQVNNKSVTQVKSFKYLGVLLSDDMTWSDHFGSINSKANKCLFFLRKLNQAGVDKSLMEV